MIGRTLHFQDAKIAKRAIPAEATNIDLAHHLVELPEDL